MRRLWTKLNTARLLGLTNLFRVLVYRAGLRTGLHPVCRARCARPIGPFFVAPTSKGEGPDAHLRQIHTPRLFGWVEFPLSDTPSDWHFNALTGQRAESTGIDWWRIPDFDPAVGDIKGIWEASRFDWTLTFAQRAMVGEATAIAYLNRWIADWCKKNPAYQGANWKCGQEASIRVMHLAMTAVILSQVQQSMPGLLNLIEVHLKRIAPTVSYALAQDNNHGTSEAAALFIGGSWLVANAGDAGHVEGERWARSGRKWLEERVQRLVAEDGSFSQYSVVYHRVLLDTLSMVEVWRRALRLQPFSARFTERARSASIWLKAFTQTANGDAPNMGANDGARLLPLSDTDFRDFRPSVQLGCALFADARAYAVPGSWDIPLQWLSVSLPERVLPREINGLCDQGGYAILRHASASVYLRYPRFRFRPSHADALHLDLWVNGRNILRDAGSYSYNPDPRWTSYFSGTVAHNTVEFDERDQMPRLGRFLFGDWLKTSERSDIEVEGEEARISVGYQDRQGATHQRQVILGSYRMLVEDKVAGFREKAILRWRLFPGTWHLEDTSIFNGRFRLAVTTSVPPHRVELVEGWESRYYFHREPLPVLEIEIRTPAVFRTELSWTL